jgi:hypothetical protein
MIQQLEWALPRLEASGCGTNAHRLHTFLLSGQSAIIEVTKLEIGIFARLMCQHVTEHESNYSLTITEGETTVILQTPIQTTQP